MPLEIKKQWFLDEKNRKVMLRGVNLGGSTKVPFQPNGATHLPSDFSDHQDVSFIGRPFPLVEADEHFSRLKKWGFNCLRFLTTWEAIEHAGPKKYDMEYLDYLTKVVEKAGDYGFYVFVDPHQDVWSRFTGGDGAPGWVFEKVGLDFRLFGKSGAATIMQEHYPDDYPAMSWAFNYQRFATCTMFTLFFGGNEFAPNTTIEGVPVQNYLQSHFINSIKQIALRIKHFDHVLGYDVLNEPGNGFIGINDLSALPKPRVLGLNISPFNSIVAGSGIAREVPVYDLRLFRLKQIGSSKLNPGQINNWIKNFGDIWRDHGIWELDHDESPKLLEPDYFRYNKNDEEIRFFRDYLRPFSIKFTNAIRQIMPGAIIFLGSDPLAKDEIYWGIDDPPKVVNANHWYDGLTLFTKTFRPYFTFDIRKQKPVLFKKFVRKTFLRQLSSHKEISSNIHGGIPTLIGEFGIPFDMNSKQAYESGNYSKHVQALSMNYDLLDDLLLNSTLWNYTADNDNTWGDQWNLEDLSIFSRDQQIDPTDINSGGRAIHGFCRPYPQITAGTPISFNFDHKKRIFRFTFQSKANIEGESEVFIPEIQYPNGFEVQLSSGQYQYDEISQILRIQVPSSDVISIIIKPK
ncbi:MAG: cellulase family glycosylhydrolase [Candidatus Kariarchaeaceae archaeon]